jgi:hypothetical protein
MADSIRWIGGSDWDLQEIQSTLTRSSSASRQRRGVATHPEEFVDILDLVRDDRRFTVVKELMVAPSASIRRGTADPELSFEVDTPAHSASVLLIRHPSGAITFHPPDELGKVRRGGKNMVLARFRVVLRGSSAQGARRGILGKAIRVVVLKVTGAVVDRVLPKAVRVWETNAWARAGRQEGWHQVTRESLEAGALEPAAPPSDKRSLLLLHGAFSHGASAFASLSRSEFFTRLASTYDRRIYAFNHYSLSRTPEENARMLLEALDASKSYEFDVVTHSRGGLVLRTLTERPNLLGGAATRVRIGKVVLVASPNEGTPLATADRWQQLLSWVANLLELFPDNPWSEAASWVVEGLVWIAHRVSGGIPGIGAMDAGSETIAALQDDPPPPRDAYSALVANYRATDDLVQRAIDVGVDLVFAAANDLVVPTEGGWRTGKAVTDFVPCDRIGCFGVGGNLLPTRPSMVSHVSFFDCPETVEFLVRALTDKPQQLQPVAIDRPLPNRRASVTDVAATAPLRASLEGAIGGTEIGEIVPVPPRAGQLEVYDGEIAPLHLILLPEQETEQQRNTRRSAASVSEETLERQISSQMIAIYGSARVLEPFYLRDSQDFDTSSAGQRWHAIIQMQERLKSYVDNKPNVTLPEDEDLIQFGTQLFETLFPNRVRRLYDEARARSEGRRLDIIFTSMIPWVADKPWEFAYDPHRRSYLATEDVQFVRNVLTAVPAQKLQPHTGPLRILVVAAQPIGQAKLSVEEEITVIRRGFEPLSSAGLATIRVLPRATPSTLHSRLSTEPEPFDVVHFIGHGEFDPKREIGYLLFEDDAGVTQRVDDKNLRSIFCQRGVRLLFLNACETGRGGKADFNRGVAPAIVAGGMPVVVANQFKVLDVSATSFAQYFYWSLAAGLTVGDAARESRIAVNYSITGEAIDWAIPVVFARDPNARFCRKPPVNDVILTAVTASAAWRADQTRFIVGVWDVQHEYPQLEDLVAMWNQAQSFYDFQVVDPSVPLGSWQIHDTDRGRMTYLRSDVLGEKLQPTVKQLGLDTLVCLITSPMTDGEDDNLISDYEPKPVILISTWGFDVSDEQLLRLLTNLVAGQLISQRADLVEDSDGPKNSPLYYNDERDVRWLIAQQKFTSATKRAIKAALGTTAGPEMDAIEKLFGLFKKARART